MAVSWCASALEATHHHFATCQLATRPAAKPLGGATPVALFCRKRSAICGAQQRATPSWAARKERGGTHAWMCPNSRRLHCGARCPPRTRAQPLALQLAAPATCIAPPATPPAAGPPADGMEGLAAMAAAAAGGGEGEGAREAVLTSEHLLNLIFSHLCLEDLCCAAMVRRGWREVTSNPEFWQTINLKGRTVMVAKVGAGCTRTEWKPAGHAAAMRPARPGAAARAPGPPPADPLILLPLAGASPGWQVRQLLRQHAGVRVLNARGVPFSSADLAHLLPRLT